MKVMFINAYTRRLEIIQKNVYILVNMINALLSRILF